VTAAEVKDALRRRHPARDSYGFVGAWTCLEEWMNIDLLAVSAWSSVKPYPRYARVGYEVKVSRADYRRELAKPGKRAAAVAFCHEFYFAIPRGLLKPDEIAWTPPWGFDAAGSPFHRLRCPGMYGSPCYDGKVQFGSRAIADGYSGRPRWYSVICQTCRGSGWVVDSPAARAGAPKLWVPDDVGLVLVDERGTTTAKKAPRRQPALTSDKAWDRDRISDAALAELIRWVSVRPDPRHARSES
jgi:hypothetical protein